MTSLDKSQSRKQRVENAVVRFLESDEHANRRRYFQARDIADSNSELTSAMVGSYLPKLEADSPLSEGITVARHTVRNSATVWVVRRESE